MPTLHRALLPLAASAALAATAVTGWWAASPHYTLYTMRSAALEGDATAFAHHVDFPALRESVRSQLKARLLAEAAATPRSSLKALGIQLALGFVDRAIESAVSPEALGLVLAGTASAGDWVETPGLAALSMLAGPDVMIQREGLDRFTANIDAQGPALLFQRDGLTWRLAELRLPAPQPDKPDA